MLSTEHWNWVQRALPIACVDLIPVQFNSSSEIARVGLIQRLAPADPAWCLLGGRILYGENIGQAGQRILSEAGGTAIRIETADWGHPDYLAEYLPRNASGLSDPRKHAIGLTFIVTIAGAFKPEGEALSFDWFDLNKLPVPLGFGQSTIFDEVFGRRG
jgi:hypothetical protein